MSAFNTLRVLLECENCRSSGSREIQFRYGHVWQHDYVIGSTVKWGPGEVGDPEVDHVVVDGWLGECPECADDRAAIVFIRGGIIYGVGPGVWHPSLEELGWQAVGEFPWLNHGEH